MLSVLVAATLFAAALAGGAAQQAMAQPPAPPPLTNEHLGAASGQSGHAGTIDIRGDCRPASGPPTVTYSATGPATGPYPGTYQETGTATLSQITTINFGVPLVAFTAQLTIDSPAGHVSGTRQLNASFYHSGICNVAATDVNQFAAWGSSYAAVITTAGVTCTTAGSADVDVSEQVVHADPSLDAARLDAWFTAGTPPTCVVPGPTSKQQCKKGGWRQFRNPSFKNQGQCIKYVNHHGSKAGKQNGRDEKRKGKKGKGNGDKKK